MPSTTNHALRYPILGDAPNVPLDLQRLADDVERELNEHDTTIAANAAAVGTMGVWQPYSAIICAATTQPAVAAPGSSVSYSRWTKIGNTVFVIGEGNSGTGTISGVSVTLPTEAGTPFRRFLIAGQFWIQGASAPTQSGVAFMTAALDRVVMTTNTSSGYVDSAASHSIRWSLTYEVV